MIAIYGSLHQLTYFVRHIVMTLIFPYCVDSGVLCVVCSFVIVSLSCMFLFDHTYIHTENQTKDDAHAWVSAQFVFTYKCTIHGCSCNWYCGFVLRRMWHDLFCSCCVFLFCSICIEFIRLVLVLFSLRCVLCFVCCFVCWLCVVCVWIFFFISF